MARDEDPDLDPSEYGQPSRLPDDLLKSPPPSDPIARATWLSDFLFALLWAEAQGRVSAKLGARLRATAGVINRSMPAADAAELDRRLKAGAAGAERDTPGPELEPFDAE